MTDLQHAPTRGVHHVEDSANAGSVNASTSRGPGGLTRSEEIQVPRSPQPLSLQIDGLNARIHDTNTAFPSYVESSERDSDTSTDPRRPEPQSASTFTDSLSSIPSSSANGYHPMKIENSQSSAEGLQTPTTYSSSQEQLPVNGKSGLDEGVYTSIQQSNGSLSPLRSPKHSTSRSGNGVSSGPRHKRTATGDVKSISSSLAPPIQDETIGAARRRSKSTGASVHGSRIAQVNTRFHAFTPSRLPLCPSLASVPSQATSLMHV